MDLNDFWQENKRWLLCVFAGLIVFCIAASIVTGTYVDPVNKEIRKAKGLWSKVAQKHYSPKQLAEAKRQQDAIQVTFGKLRDEMDYELDDRFSLNGKGDAELHQGSVYAEVRNKIFDDVDSADVEIEDKAFTWSPETNRDLIQRRLIGISLVEHTVRQLLAAHKSVTDASFEAIGLRSIDEFRMDPPRNQRGRRRRGRGDDKIDPATLIEETAVKFKFSADFATVQHFLENLRRSKPKVTIGSFSVIQGRRNGDPLVVSGDIRALKVKPVGGNP